MEVCIPGNVTPCADISSISESSTDLSNSTNSNLEDLSVDGLKAYLSEFLSIEDIEISTSSLNLPPEESNKGDAVGEDDYEDLDNIKSDNSDAEKCLGESVAFLALGKPESSDGLSNEEKVQEDDKASGISKVKCCAEPVDHGHSQTILHPTRSKLVSAMKGSREKQGITPKKLSVTWASDVYDPIPTSVSHVPSNKNQRYRHDGKKNGKKNKQKNGSKSSRGSKGKDKKRGRKTNESPPKPQSLHDDVLVDFHEPQVSDFNIVSPDPFCGSSFLKKSITNIHFPVTEAK